MVWLTDWLNDYIDSLSVCVSGRSASRLCHSTRPRLFAQWLGWAARQSEMQGENFILCPSSRPFFRPHTMPHKRAKRSVRVAKRDER